MTTVLDKVPALSSMVEPKKREALNYCKDAELAERERKSVTKKMCLMVTAALLKSVLKDTRKTLHFFFLLC